MSTDRSLLSFLEELVPEIVVQQRRVNCRHELASARGEEWLAGVPSDKRGKGVFGPSAL